VAPRTSTTSTPVAPDTAPVVVVGGASGDPGPAGSSHRGQSLASGARRSVE
jgi:hypothetical protein